MPQKLFCMQIGAMFNSKRNNDQLEIDGDYFKASYIFLIEKNIHELFKIIDCFVLVKFAEELWVSFFCCCNIFLY